MAENNKAAIGEKKEKKPEKKKGNGLFSRLGKYFRDSRGEFKKVVWPSKSQIINNCVVTLVTVLIFGVVVWGLDLLLGLLRDLVVNL